MSYLIFTLLLALDASHGLANPMENTFTTE